LTASSDGLAADLSLSRRTIMSSCHEDAIPEIQATVKPRAVAYYRQSTVDSSPSSIARQQEIVHQWAAEHDIEIIEEFIDDGPATEGDEERSAFHTLLAQWVQKRDDFLYVLCCDQSRWRRWSKHEAATPQPAERPHYGKRLVFVTMSNIPAQRSVRLMRLRLGRCLVHKPSPARPPGTARRVAKIAEHEYPLPNRPSSVTDEET
jgi:hypothetical protein